MEELKQESKYLFLSILRDKVKRDGMEDLLTFLENSDFYTAPASTRFHGSHKGGLVEHSLHVYEELMRLHVAYPEVEISEESIAIAALFHDLCKVNVYKPVKRNKKDQLGRWVEYNTYERDEKFVFGGHGSKSVYLMMKYIPLTDEEAQAINCHMGFSDKRVESYEIGKVYERNRLAWMLHVADEAATYMLDTKAGER